MIGRDKAPARRSDGAREADDPGLRADPKGDAIPLDAHIRLARPRTHDDRGPADPAPRLQLLARRRRGRPARHGPGLRRLQPRARASSSRRSRSGWPASRSSTTSCRPAAGTSTARAAAATRRTGSAPRCSREHRAIAIAGRLCGCQPTDSQLLLPAGLAASAVADTLAARSPVVTSKAHTIERTFWDTFDGRVHGAGLALVEAGRRLSLVDAATLAEQAVGRAARAARCGCSRGDLPAGALRERVAPLIEMRALAPVVRVRSRQLPVQRPRRDRQDRRAAARRGADGARGAGAGRRARVAAARRRRARL